MFKHNRTALIAATGLILATAGVAWAYTTDTDSGGSIANISGGKRFVIQQRTDSTPGRAELRGTSSTTGASASGRFKLVSGGKYVSVMQVLNVVAAGDLGAFRADHPACRAAQIGGQLRILCRTG